MSEASCAVETTYPERGRQFTQPMSQEQSAAFFACCFAEAKSPEKIPFSRENAVSDLPFLSEIVQRRIEALKLPIQFTLPALLAVESLCDRPGSAVILLVDCLNHFKDQVVAVRDLSTLYPWGFYNEDALENIIDNYMKTRKHPWSEIY